MTALTFLWNAWCALPWPAQVVLGLVFFAAFVESWCLILSAGTRCDILDRDQERERVRRALAAVPSSSTRQTAPQALASQFPPGLRDAGTCAPPGSGPGNSSVTAPVASRRGNRRPYSQHLGIYRG